MDLLFNNFGLINDICTVAIPAWLMLFTCEKMREIIVTNFQECIAKFRSSLPPNPAMETIINGKCSRINGRLYCKNNFVDKI